jgi:hypothetical protein
MPKLAMTKEVKAPIYVIGMHTLLALAKGEDVSLHSTDGTVKLTLIRASDSPCKTILGLDNA